MIMMTTMMDQYTTYLEKNQMFFASPWVMLNNKSWVYPMCAHLETRVWSQQGKILISALKWIVTSWSPMGQSTLKDVHVFKVDWAQIVRF